ncbi:MAG TPA: hypothetical protein VMR18_00830 [Candidatus Saccharimonadales bacterium]|jgi:hypothetical protein|nr:hypothetical protein [Candidatus Saccharimonadales bacterium]
MAKVGAEYIGSPEQRGVDILGASSLGLVSGPILGIAALTLGIEMVITACYFVKSV